jgi:trimeric autotransporter adhesin
MRSFFQTLSSLALLTGSSWAGASVPGQWQDGFHLSPGCDTPVRAMAERPDGKVYIGGAFRFCDGVKVNRVALFDPVANTYEPLVHNGVVGVNSTVQALAWGGGELFVGGPLTLAGTLEVNHLARWDGSGWQRLGSGLSNGVSLGSGTAQVMSMLWINDSLYVGGRFDSAALVESNNIARWSAGQWHRLGTTAANGVTGGDVIAL